MPGYDTKVWLTEKEVHDVTAVIDHLCEREDADAQGIALLGLSLGGNAALAAAARRPKHVWAVVADGASDVSW